MNKKSIKTIADLTPDPVNANRGTERGSALLDTSIERYGLGRSIVTDRDGVVLAGNKTMEAAGQKGLDKVRVVETKGDELVVVRRMDLEHGTPEATGLALADNRVGQVSLDFDMDQVRDFAENGMREEVLQFWMPEELGWEEETKDVPAPRTDEAEALREKWQVERGQLWQVGRHRLLCGDATNEEDLTRLLGGAVPTMLHTDPPYGISIVTEKEGLGTVGGSKPFGATSGTERTSSTVKASTRRGTGLDGPTSKNQIIQSNVYPVIEGDDTPFEPAFLLELAPVIILWGANYYADKLPPSSGWICWDKRENLTRNNFADGELAWSNQSVPMRIFYHLWSGLYKGSQYGQRRTHPTEKPVALFREVGQRYDPGGTWLDLYGGTGAQMIAAEESTATCLMMEIEPLYIAVVLERLSEMDLECQLINP